jgi:hypothetical protein
MSALTVLLNVLVIGLVIVTVRMTLEYYSLCGVEIMSAVSPRKGEKCLLKLANPAWYHLVPNLDILLSNR